MSEVMQGVLNMPPELWRDDPLDIAQRHGYYKSAWSEIEQLRARNAELEAQLEAKHLACEMLGEKVQELNASIDKLVDELEAQRVPDGPKGQNQFGLDARYFHEKLSLILRDIMSFTPDELNRDLTRLANTAAPAPSAPPCDCAYKDEHGHWQHSCDCRNSGDTSSVAVWCAEMNAPSAPAEVEGEREAFEAWASSRGFPIDENWAVDGNNFESPDTRLAYEIWQAARAQLGAVPVISQRHVLAITTAYEQGVGKGHYAIKHGKEVSNPYAPEWGCDIAWQMGFEEGKEQATPAAAPQPDVTAPGWDAQAYAAMRDEIEHWKRKAAEYDEALERIRNDLGPTHMGEPVMPSDETSCREAYNNRYHKIRAAVGYDEWRAIWFKALAVERKKLTATGRRDVLPDILFDGHAVLQEVRRYRAENDNEEVISLAMTVSDVLDAIVRLTKAAQPAQEKPE